MPTKIEAIGSIKLNDEFYRLIRDGEGRAWHRPEYGDEPPWIGGAPLMVSVPQETWHFGGLHTRQSIPGTSEYGQNTDARFPHRLLPGPLVTTVTLPGSRATPTCIFEAMGYLWVIAGRYVYRVDPSDDSVRLSKNFGIGIRGIMGLRWEDNQALVTTDEDEDSLWQVGIGAFQSDAFQGEGDDYDGFQTSPTTDTWTQTDDVDAYRLAAGINRLFKVDKWGELKNIQSGSDPMVEANWADPVQCGEKDVPPTGIVSFERTVLVGKAEGVYGVDLDGYGISVIKRIIRDDDNCYGMVAIEPGVIVPHSRGVYEWSPGYVESVGLERELENESPVAGVFKAFAIDNQWLLGMLTVGGDFYLMVARPRRATDLSVNPLIWDTLAYVGWKECKAAHLSGKTSPPRLWFGQGNDVAYVKLSSSGGAPDVDNSDYRFATSGSRWSSKYRFNDWGDKDIPKFDIVGKNLTDNRYWEVYYSVDGGAYSNLDVDGAAMKITTDGRHTFYLPTSAVGREVQFRYDYTSNSNTEAPELIYFEPYAVPRSRKVPLIGARLHLASGIRTDAGAEGRSVTEQFNDLEALLEQGAAIATEGPWGNMNVWLRHLHLVEAVQVGKEEPEFLVEVIMQKREES